MEVGMILPGTMENCKSIHRRSELRDPASRHGRRRRRLSRLAISAIASNDKSPFRRTWQRTYNDPFPLAKVRTIGLFANNMFRAIDRFPHGNRNLDGCLRVGNVTVLW